MNSILDFSTTPKQAPAAKTGPSSLSSTMIDPELEAFFARVGVTRGRLIIAIDATASREATWDMASKLMAEMFAAVPNGLSVQLLYFRGHNECVTSRWFTDARSMTAVMTSIMCRAGMTQIEKVLKHAHKENSREKVNAVVLVSDACEERAANLYAAARELGVPVFLFQEGLDESVTNIYREIAGITKGAVATFDAGAAARLADLLKAVAAFAGGGLKALADQNSAAARLLLTQIKSTPKQE
jgi:hypothetical protein